MHRLSNALTASPCVHLSRRESQVHRSNLAICLQAAGDSQHSKAENGHAHTHEGHGHAHSHDAHSHAHADDACKGCDDPSHAHSHANGAEHVHAASERQETTAAARFGIRTFVYTRRLPFHPQRCLATHLRSTVLSGLHAFTWHRLQAPVMDSKIHALVESGSRPWCCGGCLWQPTRPLGTWSRGRELRPSRRCSDQRRGHLWRHDFGWAHVPPRNLSATSK